MSASPWHDHNNAITTTDVRIEDAALATVPGSDDLGHPSHRRRKPDLAAINRLHPTPSPPPASFAINAFARLLLPAIASCRYTARLSRLRRLLTMPLLPPPHHPSQSTPQITRSTFALMGRHLYSASIIAAVPS
ncbi:hypothetical protein ACLOJK_040626 [Asimina triloba]